MRWILSSENRFPGLLLLGFGCENHKQASAFHLWLALFDRAVAKHLIEAGHDVHADLAVRDLASAEADGHLDFVAVRKELDALLGLDLHVANVDGCGEANLFEFDDLLILTRRQRRESSSEASLEVRLGTCNARRDRILNPPGIHVSFTVVVSFHENFITKVDKAYQISCSYEEYDRSVTTQIDVSPPPETNLEAHIEPPKCEYRITSPSGKPINNVLVGETIQHTWSCSSANGYHNLHEVYGILVHNCFVEDGKKNKVKIIDEEGCSIYPEIFGTPEYSKNSVSATIKNLVVKFPDQNSVDYQCSIHTCVRAEGHCDGITVSLRLWFLY